jgi:succinate dehydrogenase/fumarate reductase flavoprotein subunit
MGGIAVDETMATGVPRLLAAGEAVGGANGANRLSGNAITEALVFGREAGRSAATSARRSQLADAADNAHEAVALIASGSGQEMNTAAMLQRLQATMSDDVGPLRDGDRLTRALGTIDELAAVLGDVPFGAGGRFDMVRMDWFDLRNMLLVARAVTISALARTESRGAHQRADHPGMLPEWHLNQMTRLTGTSLTLTSVPASPAEVAAQ